MIRVRHVAGLGALALAAGRAGAAVLGLTVADASTGNYALTSLSVTRGSAGTITYTPGRLIGVDLTDGASVQVPLAVTAGTSVPAVGTRAALLEDFRLDTGVINPFGNTNPDADSFEVTFRSPVVNSTGEDIVVLEIGSGDATSFWVDNNRAARGRDVTASNFSGTLLGGMPFTLYKYAGATDSNINDLAELESATGFSLDKDDVSTIVGLGLDLSSFGVPLGASVTSLRFQAGSASSRIDPVLIVGLPPVPIAGDANLDGRLNADDFALLDRGFVRYTQGVIPAGRANWSDGDFDRNGVINQNDYLLLDGAFANLSGGVAPELLAAREAEFGAGYVSSLVASVPEPSTVLVAACGAVVAGLRRGRRTRAVREESSGNRFDCIQSRG